jgi:hypothetical protein
MKLKLSLKSLSVIIILAIIAFLLIWAFVKGRKELAMEQERERAIKATSRVSIQDSEMVLTLDRTTQIESEITVVSLTATSHREEFRAYGIVLPVQELVDLRNSFTSAKAQVEKYRASVEASRREYERLKALHEDSRNISDKVFQAAEATWRSDEANVRAAEEALHALEGTARQQWGTVITRWLFDESPAFDRLLRQDDTLIQVTLPSGTSLLSSPQTALVEAASGTSVSATLVSPSPRTDPRIQGMSFFYVALSQIGLLPGMNVSAYLPVGPQVQRVVVPATAVVWLQGKAWVYVQKDAEHFARREISTGTPVKDGWFIVKGLSAGDRVVVSGAQLLLSEEFRTQVQGGEEVEK